MKTILKKSIFIISAAAILCLSACSKEAEVKLTADNTAETDAPHDNSTYRNVLDNYYKAYENCDAAYQMATFAPAYKEYVIKQYGYGNEENMERQLQTIIDEACEQYSTAYGENFLVAYDVKNEKNLSGGEIAGLEEEMESLYGGGFVIGEAVEATISVVISGESEQAGKSEDTLTFGKLSDGNWYLLK